MLQMKLFLREDLVVSIIESGIGEHLLLFVLGMAV